MFQKAECRHKRETSWLACNAMGKQESRVDKNCLRLGLCQFFLDLRTSTKWKLHHNRGGFHLSFLPFQDLELGLSTHNKADTQLSSQVSHPSKYQSSSFPSPDLSNSPITIKSTRDRRVRDSQSTWTNSKTTKEHNVNLWVSVCVCGQLAHVVCTLPTTGTLSDNDCHFSPDGIMYGLRYLAVGQCQNDHLGH